MKESILNHKKLLIVDDEPDILVSRRGNTWLMSGHNNR
jgi:hypothetical protein